MGYLRGDLHANGTMWYFRLLEALSWDTEGRALTACIFVKSSVARRLKCSSFVTLCFPCLFRSHPRRLLCLRPPRFPCVSPRHHRYTFPHFSSQTRMSLHTRIKICRRENKTQSHSGVEEQHGHQDTMQHADTKGTQPYHIGRRHAERRAAKLTMPFLRNRFRVGIDRHCHRREVKDYTANRTP